MLNAFKRHFPAVMLCIIVTFLTAWILIPFLIRKTAPGLLRKYFETKNLSMELRKISFCKLDVAAFSLGPEKSPFLSAESLRLDISLPDIVSGKFKKLSLGGGVFRFSFRDGRFFIPGFAETFRKSLDKSSSSAAVAKPEIGVKCPGHIELRNFILELDIEGRTIRVPVDADLRPDGGSWAFMFSMRPFEKGSGIRGEGVLVYGPDLISISLTSLSCDFSGSEFFPLPSKLNGLKLSGIFSASGSLSFSLGPERRVSCDMKAEWKNASASYSGVELKMFPKNDKITLRLAGSGKSFSSRLEGISLASGPLSADIKSLSVISQEKDGCVALSVPEFPLILSSGTSKLFDGVHEFKFSGRGSFFSKGGKWDFASWLKVENLSLNIGGLKCSMKSPVLSIAVSDGTKAGLEFESGPLKMPGAVTVSSIKAKFPLFSEGSAGLLTTGQVSFSGKEFGRLAISMEKAGYELLFKGRVTDSRFPGLESSFAGKSVLFGGKGDTRVDYVVNLKDISVLKPGDFYKPCDGYELKGSLACKGTFVFKPGFGMTAPFSANIDGMRIENKEKKLLAEGIKVIFFVPDLIYMNGAGRQRINFERIELGNVRLGPGIILFRMEPQHACFIEKFEAKCSDGSIALHALKIIPGIPDYRTVLFCDRLKFSSVLEQFGLLNGAEGKGTVSGRIPLVYFNGTLSVEDGFLFSSPGDGGRIRLSSPDMLSPETVGVDIANSVQLSHIAMAREALTSFDYQWAKLNIRSEGDVLLLMLAMYGKPAKPLLFAYKEELGGYVKVKTEEEGAIFKEMMLELNFRLPVNKMIGYGSGIWRMFDEFNKLKSGAVK